MTIKTIIFDLGGVLIDWNPDYLFSKLIPNEEKRAFFFQNVCTYEWNMEHDAGRPVSEGTALKIAEFPEWENEIRAYYDRWTEMLGEALHDTVEVLKELIAHPDYRVLALTNWSAETFPIALKMFDFLHWFEGIVVSGDEKTRKPYPKIYETLLTRYAVEPSEAVFIDDSLPNIQTAEAIGIHGIHFKNGLELRSALQNLGVKI
jgi:2-haloacid dehalogenase